MKKEFKTGDKVFHTRLRKYGFFVDYSKWSDDYAVVSLFYDDNFKETMFVSLHFLEKAIVKKYEVFWKFYINNNKNLKGIKKKYLIQKTKLLT